MDILVFVRVDKQSVLLYNVFIEGYLSRCQANSKFKHFCHYFATPLLSFHWSRSF